MAFSLEKFEALAYSHDRELGMRELLALLQDLDANYGNLSEQFKAQPLQSVSEQDRNIHLWTRAAAAASSLLADKQLFLLPNGGKTSWRITVGCPPCLQLRRFAMPTT